MKLSHGLIGVALLLSFEQGISAVPKKYNIFMRVGLGGSTPISLNTIANPGKKSTVTEISEDGKTQTTVELLARQANGDSIVMDLSVEKKVNGKIKKTEKAQILAKVGQEAEVRVGSKRKSSLDVGVIAHPM